MRSMASFLRRVGFALVAMGLGGCVSDPESMPRRADDGFVLSGRSAAQPFDLGAALDVDRVVLASFVRLAMHAARAWRFEPAVRCVFANAEAKTAATNTGCAGATEIPQAVSLHYRFVFEQDEGRGAVRLAR